MVYNDDGRIFRIKRNLKDAGFNALQSEIFVACFKDNDRQGQYRMLKKQKLRLLEELHKSQYKIDCLDHMIYTMKQEDKNEKEKQ